MSQLEAKRVLRRLELEAYASVISAFRAQGHLTVEKKSALNLLCQHLGISGERHHVEVRRAVCDEDLANIADCIFGFGTSRSWQPEGRRLARSNPRLVARHTYSSRLPAQTLTALTSGMVGVTVRTGSGVNRRDGGEDPEKKIPPQVQSALRAIMTHPPNVGSTLRQRTVRSVSCQAQVQEKKETVGVQTDLAFPADTHAMVENVPVEPPSPYKSPPANKPSSPDLQTVSIHSVKRALSPCTLDENSAKKPCICPVPSPISSDSNPAMTEQLPPISTSAVSEHGSTPVTSIPSSVPAVATPAVATPAVATPAVATLAVAAPASSVSILQTTNPVPASSSDEDSITITEPLASKELPVPSTVAAESLPCLVEVTCDNSIPKPVTDGTTVESTTVTNPQVTAVETIENNSKNQIAFDENSMPAVPRKLSLTDAQVVDTEGMRPNPSLSVGSIEVTTLYSSLMSPNSTNAHTLPSNTIPCEDTPTTPLPDNIEDGDLLDRITSELGVDSLDPALLNMADLFTLFQQEPEETHSPQSVGDVTIQDSTYGAAADQPSFLLSSLASPPIPSMLPSLSELPRDDNTISLDTENVSNSAAVVIPTLGDPPTPQLSLLPTLPDELSNKDLLEDLPPELQETVHAILKSSSNNLPSWQ